MSEIIETYQQEQEQLGKTELPQMAFATVVSVNDDGLELIFDGEEEASTKRFPCNTGVSFEADQRVLMMKVNGSYVALCPVGWKGSGGGGSGTEIVVEDSEFPYGRINSMEFVEDWFNASKSGHRLLGVIGWCINEINTPTEIALSYCYIDGNRVYVGMSNRTNTSYLNVYVKLTLMYEKI